jgi:hypothetical protein
MQAEKGSRVSISFTCRLQDGKAYHVGTRNTLELMVGAGSVPPALEAGLLGMQPGERRSIRVPAAEVNAFPFPGGAHFVPERETPPGIAYEFGPGDAGDVAESIPAGRNRQFREPLPAGADMIFEIEMLAVQAKPAK